MSIGRGAFTNDSIDLVVIGCSAGGIDALKKIFSELPTQFQASIAIVQHVSGDSSKNLADFFNDLFKSIKIKEAEDKECLGAGTIYFAPAGYHLMISTDRCFELSVEEPMNYSRPSIDILFETAAEAYGKKLLGIILTGANADGAKGLAKIAALGGKTFIQDPLSAEYKQMPQGALAAVPGPDAILSLTDICCFLARLLGDPRQEALSP